MEGNDPLGLEVFAHALEGLEGSYALIGGMACSILMERAELPFRATRDFDVVLIADGDVRGAARAVWTLVREGGYRIRERAAGTPIFYRFDKPRIAGYPRMIELFAKSAEFRLAAPSSRIVPMPIDDDISSLSAILLDDDYYSFLLSGVETVALKRTGSLRVLGADRLIAFKAKAFLDLDARRRRGEPVDEKSVRKHKNDVFRLLQLIAPSQTLRAPDGVAADVSEFIDRMRREEVDLRSLVTGWPSKTDAINALAQLYGLPTT